MTLQNKNLLSKGRTFEKFKEAQNITSDMGIEDEIENFERIATEQKRVFRPRRVFHPRREFPPRN